MNLQTKNKGSLCLKIHKHMHTGSLVITIKQLFQNINDLHVRINIQMFLQSETLLFLSLTKTGISHNEINH